MKQLYQVQYQIAWEGLMSSVGAVVPTDLVYLTQKQLLAAQQHVSLDNTITGECGGIKLLKLVKIKNTETFFKGLQMRSNEVLKHGAEYYS